MTCRADVQHRSRQDQPLVWQIPGPDQRHADQAGDHHRPDRPVGCGKTTLFRSFNRINERYGNVTTSGQIRILGKNIFDEDVSLAYLRKRVGMVFQRPNPFPISIYENVVFGMPSLPRRLKRADTRCRRGKPSGRSPSGMPSRTAERQSDDPAAGAAAETCASPVCCRSSRK